MKKSILIIDDDLSACREIKDALSDDTTDVFYTLSINDALKMLTEFHLSIIIMDTHLSDLDGHKILETIRKIKPIPILVLSTHASSAERTTLLQLGASAYMEKASPLSEIVAQAKSLMGLQICAVPIENERYTLFFGNVLTVDPTSWNVTLDGDAVALTHIEFELLYCLASHKGQVLTRGQLYSQVWGSDSDINVEATIKSHIRSLRQKLAPYGKRMIETVRGVGYKFNAHFPS